MYSLLHELLSDKKGGEIFTVFGLCHVVFLVLTVLAIVVLVLGTRRQSAPTKKRVTRILIGVAFGLYVADFFLMPLAYGEIDVEKLPFHACTATCVLCFLSDRLPRLEKLRRSFVLLGFLSNFVYLVYPAGVMWHAVHPLSYRVLQTLLFHSVMTVYCSLVLTLEHEKFTLRRCHRDLLVLVGMTAWALLGNYAYNGTADGYSHFFNWFFVVRDPFYLLPADIAPFVMPFLNIAVFFLAEVLLLLITGIRGIHAHAQRASNAKQ